MTTPSNQLPPLLIDETPPESTQYVTFKLAEYLFALPTQDILKVVAAPPPSQGGLIEMGMVQLGPYSLDVIDLHKLLALHQTSDARPSVGSSRALENRASENRKELSKKASTQQKTDDNPPFLIVLQNTEKNLWCIPVHEPPDLMEVPNYALKPVPEHRRLTRALRWVSHIVSYDLNSDRHSLLILDLSVILAPARAEPALEENPKFMEIKPPLETTGETVRQSEMYA
ncbi:MAG: hypothetical protein AAFO06_18725 [Cyanobacteria bacterium J06597_16]